MCFATLSNSRGLKDWLGVLMEVQFNGGCMASLVLSRGHEDLLEYPLRSSRIVVGRADHCDLVVPSELVSRTHCVLTLRDGCWILADRSRHGTCVNKVRIDGSHVLNDGEVVQMGTYEMRFVKGPATQLGRTISTPVNPPPPEQLVAVHGDQMAVEMPLITVVDGPGKGFEQRLEKRRQSLGGQGSDVEVPESPLLPGHAVLRVSRGRLMVAPGTGLIHLNGERILSVTPIFVGERFSLGKSTFELSRQLFEKKFQALSFGEMVGQSESMRRLFGLLERMSAHSAPVLLLGESGTGKELAAQGLHSEGPRSSGPFVALNCGAISEKLLESELFGHEKGAFTDAKMRKDGAFQRANRGTLFLDEIGELPLASQAKLLRTLETGEVCRVGGSGPSYPDVRVVAATNRDLEKEVREGRFREDLFFRLAVLGLRIPPLRERREDFASLVCVLCDKLGRDVQVTDEALQVLKVHAFPGNVRELRNVLTRAFVLGGPKIDTSTIQFSPWATSRSNTSQAGSVLKQTERSILKEAFERLSGNRSAMARELGVPRTTLHYKLRRFGIAS